VNVALVHDPTTAQTPQDELPEDHGAEYDDRRTINALLEAIRSNGHSATDLLLTDDFQQEVRHVVPDLVFNIAEGRQGPGRESVVPSWLEHVGIPYTGSDARTMAVTLDKHMSKALAQAHGILTAGWDLLESKEQVEDVELSGPMFVKPNAEGSSMGIRRSSVVRSEEELREAATWVIENYPQGCLVEEFLPGREFCAGFLGNADLQELPVVEIKTENGYYPYEDKSRHRKDLECPAEISATMRESILEMGRRAYRTFRCRDLGRVDIKLDKDGQPRFVEINPLPGLSPDYSIFTHQARAAGLSFKETIGRIIHAATCRCGPREGE